MGFVSITKSILNRAFTVWERSLGDRLTTKQDL
jgi:hypothetical protein